MQGKIGIFGDSWGCGEWNEHLHIFLKNKKYTHKNLHKGLEQYLSNSGYRVKNYSIPAGSNLESVEKIKKHYKNFDTIIWIVTEPSRDFMLYNNFLKKKKRIFKKIKKTCFLNQCKEITFKHFRNISKLCKNKIIVVGGLHRINLQKTTFQNSLNWLDLLCGKKLPTYYINDYHPGMVKNKFEQIKVKNIYNFILDHGKKLFNPDGVHPNRIGHYILYKKIENILRK